MYQFCNSVQWKLISTHFDAKIITLWYSCQKLWYVEHRQVWYHSKQFYIRFGLTKIYVYFCGPSKTKMFHNTSFLSSFHTVIVTSVCHDCVWCDKYLGRMYQILYILTLVHILTNFSNHFYCKVPHTETHLLIGSRQRI